MRATRALLRRRLPLPRKRAALRAHIPQTNSQYTLPEMGKQRADQANRDGVAARGSAPAVQKSVAVELALLGDEDQVRSDVAWPIVQTAKQHDAPPLDRRQSVPGIGQSLRGVLLYASPDLSRFPRVQDCGSSCRRVQCAQASAGQRDGTSGAQSGHA